MDLLWMILTVFLACAEAENLTEVRVKLGQNVTINCSLDSSDIYWYVEIHNQLRACIVRMFGNGPDEKQYYICTTKYAAVENRLEITNITADDCRLYFCARKKKGIIQFKDSILLVPDVLITNNSEANHHIWRILQSDHVIFSSFALNVFLFVVIGLFFTSLCLKRKNCNDQVNDPSAFTCETPETLETPQYEEIHLPTYRAPPPAAAPPDCIYHKAQLPRSTLP